MNIQVKNITYSSATITWSPTVQCPEKHYQVMYRPSWNGIFSGYLRQNFHREERIPRSLSSVALRRLTPATVYILCVACKSSYPSSDYCTTFQTLDKTQQALGGSGLDSSTSLWVVGCLLLVCFVAILIYGCLQFCCTRCQPGPQQYSTSSERHVSNHQAWPESHLASGLGEQTIEVPIMTVVLRNPNFQTGSAQRPPYCSFSYKNVDEKKAILPTQCT
ncbi:fibronectin type III domain-containing protein 9 [Rhinatrema bivittatum]|uniref:fibronectin type III domain-containing protein 9 n=1 Tax=Rhinatrema bivittatum TaxID=194408 RepID=UPI00112B31CF|nr:fibronectin type III domain-containing protein 9 [Rhinatrema bivittatum]